MSEETEKAFVKERDEFLAKCVEFKKMMKEFPKDFSDRLDKSDLSENVRIGIMMVMIVKMTELMND